MQRYAAALETFLEAARERGRRPFQSIPLKDCVGRIASTGVRGNEDLPPFANSAMDGYALSAELTTAARADNPVRLEVCATLIAGDAPPTAPARAAVEVMTGAPVPEGCDAVVKLEDVERLGEGAVIVLREPAHSGDFVRPRGGDFAKGATILKEGEVIATKHVLALAALGVGRVSVRLRPRVALISTGRELVPHTEKPAPGQIRNATAPYLVAELERLGCQIVSQHSVGDDPSVFRELIETLLDDDLDLIVTTGAVSMGAHDFIPRELAALGAETLFHKTATRPGKPVLGGRFGSGPLFLGLPGNPVSTAAALRFFAVPAIRFWMGQPDEKPRRLKLSAAVEKPEGLRCFFKAVSDGVSVTCLAGQASYQIAPLLEADCWAVLPEEGALLAAGVEVEVYPL